MPPAHHVLCTAFALFAATGASATDSSAWRELSRHTLGGTGGWDLLTIDAEARRVYFTRGEYLLVADVDSGKSIDRIGGLKRAHGVALVPAFHRGYVSSGGDDRIVAFDLVSLKPLADIPAGKNPDAVVFDPASGHVFAFNGRSNDATVVDPSSDSTIATIALPGKPELAAADGHGRVFVNIEDKNAIAAIDSKADTVVATWALGGCEEPSGLAIDAANARLFAVCSNRRMIVLDAHNGRAVTSVPIGDHPDGAAFDPASRNAFSSNSDGTLTIVHEEDPHHFRVAATVATPPRARTIALDPKAHRVVLPFAEFGAPPEPSAQEPHPRPPIKPDTFGFVVIGSR